MAFWGVEIKPGKPYSHRFDRTRGRLHISQATLGIGKSQKKSLVQCCVGDKSPILLCSLIPDKVETCPLDFEFEEEDEVVFSVIGPTSVHVGGYYFDKSANFDADGDDEFDSYGEDIGESDSEQSTDFDTDDDYADDFSDDDNIEMFPTSRRPNRGVVIEEILDDEKPAKENGNGKHLKKKYQASDSDGDNQKQIIVGVGSSIFESETDGSSMSESETEDEDGLTIPSLSKTNDEIQKKSDKKWTKVSKKKSESAELRQKPDETISKGSKKKGKDGTDKATGTKRKSQDIQDGETERGSSLPSLEVGQENADKPKKKKKKQQKIHGVGDDSMDDDHKEEKAQMEEAETDGITQVEPVRDEANKKPSNEKSVQVDANHVDVADEGTSEKKKKKKKKKKKNQTPEGDGNANTEKAKKGDVVEIENKKEKMKPTQERTYSNGLVVEELQMGKPDGKRASPGNRVSVHYIGKLKKNGQIFDSSIRGRNPPFQFRLGLGQVIKGWDVGVNGMRIGDKRRLTIPPSMGYGTEGARPKIPPNAWLLFDVELVAVC